MEGGAADESRSIVLAWGSGEDGQLGIVGPSKEKAEEKEWACRIHDALDQQPAAGDDQICSVVAGSRSSLAISKNGRLFTWGWNQRGTLGHHYTDTQPPDTKTIHLPLQVTALKGVKIVQAAYGGWHCLAVDDRGKAYAWGGNEYGQCGEVRVSKSKESLKTERNIFVMPDLCAPNLSVRQVAAGGMHSVVLTNDGHVWTWGQPWPPGDIKQISTPVRMQGLEKVRMIAVGAFHNLALLEDGTLRSWGNNEYGQLGTGDTQPRSQPISVEGLQSLTLVEIAAGGWHSAALTDDGEVYAWGRGEHGRLGFGDDKSSKTTPHKVELLSGLLIAQISCGGTHSVARTRDGRMFSYGRGDHGRLGFGKRVTTGNPTEVPVNIPAPKGVTGTGRWFVEEVACGGRHALAIASWVVEEDEDMLIVNDNDMSMD